MLRSTKKIQLKNNTAFKKQLLLWAQKFDTVVWLDSNNYPQKHTNFEAVLAVGNYTSITTNYKNAFEKLSIFQQKTNDFIFGYLGYDLKNDVESLSSQNFDGLEFPDLFFFQPKKIILIKNNTLEFQYLGKFEQEIAADFKEIQLLKPAPSKNNTPQHIQIKQRIDKKTYLQKAETVLKHINRGNVYEANFCQEFYCENTAINPIEVYQNLNEISEPPFATFLKFENNYLLSASPERYLKKEGENIISQPIKGTAKRASNSNDDKKLKQNLENDTKERAENIMIVDLVRNDLSHHAIKGSVKVEELCQVYTFKQVHQLISTVSSKVSKNTPTVDFLKSTFPMGSMTGAPKIAAMKIIENLEETKRGLYSGSVGYISPKGNFDFNVIIRSILYNHTKKYVSFSVGSAITAKSNPEKEYQECLLKANAMKEVLLKHK